MEENYYLAKWLNDELDGPELIAFKNTKEYKEFEKIKSFSNQLEVSKFEEDLLLKKIISNKKEETKVVQFKKQWFYKIAAVIVVALGISFFMYQNFSIQKEFAYNGEKKSLFLPDNSEVVLNSGSDIEYKKWRWDNNRNLHLNGEAYFHVAKGKKFEVQTNLGKVGVLGTQFNVKNRENRFDVTCFEGKVRVNYNNEEIILTKGMQAVFENGVLTRNTTTASKPDWMNDEITFDKASLQVIINEIERQYNISIENKSTRENDVFSGKIPTNDLDVAMKIVCSTFNLKVIKKSKTLFVFENN